MEYTGHMSKRQRTTTDGHGAGTANEDKFDAPHKTAVSRVVHVRQLSDYASESHLLEAVQCFGAVRNIMMMRGRGQALIEFEDVASAKSCVTCSQVHKVFVCGKTVFFNYSTSQEIRPREGDEASYPTNNILLFTIINAHYPITVDVMHTICQSSGNIVRIVIFKKKGVQAMVEFETSDEAVACKEALQGADIYSGCCTLKIDFAKTDQLNVVKNDSESWDYTRPNLGKEGMPKTLLPDPQIGTGGMGGFGLGGGFSGPGMFSGNAMQRGMGGGNMYSGPGPTPFGDNFGDSSYGQGYSGPGKHDMYSGPGSQFQDSMGGGHGPGMGALLMMYNVNKEQVNCDRLFNLLCLYGNVNGIKFLRSKDAVMIEMGDPGAVERCISLLAGHILFEHRIQLSQSKQAHLQEVLNPFNLPDGTPSYKNFIRNRNNRYTTPQAASKNRCIGPSRYLHYFNAPPNITDEEIIALFTQHGIEAPKVTQLPKASPKSSTGNIEFATNEDCMNALTIVNHEKISSASDESNPYVIRLCFSMPPRNRDQKGDARS